VPVLAVAGQVFDEHVLDRAPGSVEAVSLVDRYGDDAARTATTGCITDAVASALAARASG
jgi:hypothetical protein